MTALGVQRFIALSRYSLRSFLEKLTQTYALIISSTHAHLLDSLEVQSLLAAVALYIQKVKK